MKYQPHSNSWENTTVAHLSANQERLFNQPMAEHSVFVVCFRRVQTLCLLCPHQDSNAKTHTVLSSISLTSFSVHFIHLILRLYFAGSPTVCFSFLYSCCWLSLWIHAHRTPLPAPLTTTDVFRNTIVIKFFTAAPTRGM